MKGFCLRILPFSVTAIVILVAGAFAQADRPSATAAGVRNEGASPIKPAAPSDCSPCLYYSGDFDANNPNANGLRNGNETWEAVDSQVWVPFIPTSDGVRSGTPPLLIHKHILVTKITFNMLMNQFPSDLTKTTWAFKTLVSSGNFGLNGAHNTCGFVTVTATGNSGFGFPEYSITCNLKTAVKLAVGTNYWVNIYPTFTSSSFGFVSGVEDVPPLNLLGWGDDFDNSFFYSIYFGANYAPATSLGNNGEDEFSIAIAGTYVL
jgi:hypothetical protein